MKKTILISALLLVMIAMPFALAQDINNSEVQDLTIMSNVNGIELRLEQLQEALEIKIDNGNNVIEVLENNDSNTSKELEIVANLQLLLEKAKTLNAQDSDVVESIISIKDESFDLAKEFRESVSTKLTAQNRQELALSNKADKRDIRAQHKAKIEEKIKKTNNNRLIQFMMNKGINDETLRNQLINKEITPAQAMKELRENIHKMNKSQKNKLKQKIAQDNAKRKINALNIREKSKKRRVQIFNEIKERVKSRLDTLRENRKSIMDKRISNKVGGKQ